MFTFDAIEVIYLAADALALALGLALWFVGSRGWAARLFGSYLVLRGIHDITVSLALNAIDPGTSIASFHVANTFLGPPTIFLFAFLLIYPRVRGPVSGATIFLGAIGVSLIWVVVTFLQPHWVGVYGYDAVQDRVVFEAAGFLFWMAGIATLMEVIVPLLLLRSLVTASHAQAKSLVAITLGLGINTALYTGQSPYGLIWSFGSTPQLTGTAAFQFFIAVATFVLGLLFVVMALTLRHKAEDPAPLTTVAIVYAGAALASFLLTTWESFLPLANVGTMLMTTLGAISWFLLPAMTSYAFLRYGLFDIDLKVKFALTQSTIATIFAVLFFILSERVEQAFNTTTSTAGILTAAAIALAFRPIQLGATALVNKVMPNVKSIADMNMAEAERFYEEQVELAWEDAYLGDKEKQLLQNIRERLHLDVETAARIEAKVGCMPIHAPGGKASPA